MGETLVRPWRRDEERIRSDLQKNFELVMSKEEPNHYYPINISIVQRLERLVGNRARSNRVFKRWCRDPLG